MMARQGLKSPEGLRGGLEEGSREVEFLPGLTPRAEELVLTKSTASFFVGTPLEIRLRARGIATLVLAGVATEHGIEFTARHASALGFYVVVAADACGTFDVQAHDNSLRYLRSTADVLASSEIAAIWSRC
jgi:nicotinamidase-related amidase